MRLIVSIVFKKFKAYNHLLTDLFQEGVVGLTTAISNYDYRRNQKLSTYATWWITQDINRYIANTGRAIRLPVHKHEDWLKLTRAERALTARLGREVTTEELAQNTSMSTEMIEVLKNAGNIHLDSLNRTLGDDKERELGSVLTHVQSEHEIDGMVEDLTIHDAMDEVFISGGLTLKQAQLLSLKYGIYRPELSGTKLSEDGTGPKYYDECFENTFKRGRLTIVEIAEVMGLTNKIVRTTEEDAFKLLRRLRPGLISAVAD